MAVSVYTVAHFLLSSHLKKLSKSLNYHRDIFHCSIKVFYIILFIKSLLQNIVVRQAGSRISSLES